MGWGWGGVEVRWRWGEVGMFVLVWIVEVNRAIGTDTILRKRDESLEVSGAARCFLGIITED